MTPRRRLQATASAAFAVAALTACEAPTPIVTIVNSGRSVYSEANVYCFEGQSLDQRNCAVRQQGTTELAVVGDLPLGIDVGKELADASWTVQVTDTADPRSAGGECQPPFCERSEPQSGHYFSFQVPRLNEQGSLLLTVQAFDDKGQLFGEWRFSLVGRR